MILTDHQEQSYIIRVMKTGRLITCNKRHICSIPITTEQYLWEQFKKETGWLEDIFMWAVSVKQVQIPQPNTAHRDRCIVQ